MIIIHLTLAGDRKSPDFYRAKHKHHFDPGPTLVMFKVDKVVIMQQGCHINAYHLMQQYITIVI